MSKIFARIVFLPSLVWDISYQLIHRLNWWDVIEPGIILGSVPFSADVKRLHALGVRSVVNTCEEFNGPISEYENFGIDQLRIPIIDFSEPSRNQIRAGVEYINRKRAKGSVYVHCKSGRGRSATILLCWLIQTRNLSPEAAQQRLQARRRQVLPNLFSRKSVCQYWREIGDNDDHTVLEC